MKAKFWVIATGLDCDGYNSGFVSSFYTANHANNYAEQANKDSDGLIYAVIKDVYELKAYCDFFGKDYTNYLN